MPRPRFQRLDPEKRRAIMDAAAEAFASHGLEGASYNQIIERAGISKGAMYYYFDDKEDLYATVVREVEGDVMAVMSDLPPVRSVEEFWLVLGGLVERLMAFAQENPVAIGVVRSVLKLKGTAKESPVLKELYATSKSFSEQMLRLGQEVGAIRTDLPFDLLVSLATAIDTAGDEWLVEHVETAEADEWQRWNQLFLDIWQRLFSPEHPIE